MRKMFGEQFSGRRARRGKRERREERQGGILLFYLIGAHKTHVRFPVGLLAFPAAVADHLALVANCGDALRGPGMGKEG